MAVSGFQNVTQRDISNDAGTNLALINYHFGNRIGLLHAVLERAAKPIIEQINRHLDACDERAKKTGRLDAGEIIESYLRPVMSLDMDDAESARLHRMFGLAFSDPSMEMGRAIHRIFREVASRYSAMLREACPELSSQEFYWRMVSTFGAMIYLLAEPGWVRQLVGSGFDVSDKNAAVTCAMPFLAAGMTAPSDFKRVASPRSKASRPTAKKPAEAVVKRAGKTASPA
jgi:AcrR family transcriptional regulator